MTNFDKANQKSYYMIFTLLTKYCKKVLVDRVPNPTLSVLFQTSDNSWSNAMKYVFTHNSDHIRSFSGQKILEYGHNSHSDTLLICSLSALGATNSKSKCYITYSTVFVFINRIVQSKLSLFLLLFSTHDFNVFLFLNSAKVWVSRRRKAKFYMYDRSSKLVFMIKI